MTKKAGSYQYRGELPPTSVVSTVVEVSMTSSPRSKAGKLARTLLNAEGLPASPYALEAARAVVGELDELDIALRNPDSPITDYFEPEPDETTEG